MGRPRKHILRSRLTSKRVILKRIHAKKKDGLRFISIANDLNFHGLWYRGQKKPWTAESARWLYRTHHDAPVKRLWHRYAEMPRGPGACVNGPRPCPFASCRHHMAHLHIRIDAHDTRPESGVMAAVEDGDFSGVHTCVHDLVEASGWMTNSEIADELGVSREHARRLVNGAMASVEAKDPDLGHRLRLWYAYSATIKREQ